LSSFKVPLQSTPAYDVFALSAGLLEEATFYAAQTGANMNDKTQGK
jgi:hypothetical protein